MDINTVRGLLTLLLLVLFVWLFFWAYSKKQKPAFDEAAHLPFADEHMNQRSSAAASEKSPENGEPS